MLPRAGDASLGAGKALQTAVQGRVSAGQKLTRHTPHGSVTKTHAQAACMTSFGRVEIRQTLLNYKRALTFLSLGKPVAKTFKLSAGPKLNC